MVSALVCDVEGCENTAKLGDGEFVYCCAAHREMAYEEARAGDTASAEPESAGDLGMARSRQTLVSAGASGTVDTAERVTTTHPNVVAEPRTRRPSPRPRTIPQPDPAPEPVSAPEPSVQTPGPVPTPEPVSAPEPSVQAPEPIAAPEPEPAPEPVSTPEPEPEPARVAAAHAIAPVPTPAAPAPAPISTPAAPAPGPAASPDGPGGFAATAASLMRAVRSLPVGQWTSIARNALSAVARRLAGFPLFALLRTRLAALPWQRWIQALPGSTQDTVSAALHSLTSNRLRSLLTIVGIIAGVASVIVLVSMGDGMTKGFEDQWGPFATQVLVQPITGPVATSKAPQHLTDADLRALKDPKATPDVATWSPVVASSSVTFTVDQQKANGPLFGIEENYLDMANRHITAGTWFTDDQMASNARSAVLGPEVINELWPPGTDPASVVGQYMRLGHSVFRIQGVVNSDGQQDNVVLVPLGAARSYVIGNNAGKLDVIIAKSTSVDTLEQAQAEIYQVLYTQHRITQATDRDFYTSDNTNVLNQQRSSIKFMAMFILAVAAISLFVGGVGVANIMLVSVTERTREIGIRKAIGAPRSAIMRQFLSEAVLLTTLGGIIGVVLGVAFCLVGAEAIPALWPPDPASMTPTPVPLLSASPVFIAFGVSVLIGLLAGGYPAYRAAHLRPIEALRFE